MTQARGIVHKILGSKVRNKSSTKWKVLQEYKGISTIAPKSGGLTRDVKKEELDDYDIEE